MLLSCGYEDCNDVKYLEHDPASRALCGGELPCQPTVSRWENALNIADVARLAKSMIQYYVASLDPCRKEVPTIVSGRIARMVLSYELLWKEVSDKQVHFFTIGWLTDLIWYHEKPNPPDRQGAIRLGCGSPQCPRTRPIALFL